MTRNRKKICGFKYRKSGIISLNVNELRTAGLSIGDVVEVEAEQDRIVIYRMDD